jgi:hypothetical protein
LAAWPKATPRLADFIRQPLDTGEKAVKLTKDFGNQNLAGKEGATNFRLRENISMSFIYLFCDAIFRVGENSGRVARAPRKNTRPLGRLPILRLRVGLSEEKSVKHHTNQ